MSAESRRRILNSFLQGKLSSWGKFAELIFYPSFCHLCSRLLEFPGESVICRFCWEKVVPSSSPYCLSCGRFFEGTGDPHLCLDCIKKRPPFSLHRSCGRYRGMLKDAILLFKYRGFRRLGRGLARFAARSLKKEEMMWWEADFLIPVPLHPRKRRQRGFNQAEVIARELSRLKGIELAGSALVKVKNVPPQTGLDMEERRKNVRGAYRVRNGKTVEGKVVILIDDVCTTGSTLRECSSALKAAGAKEVRALTVAQA